MHYIVTALDADAKQLFAYKSNIIPAPDDLIKFEGNGYKVLRRVHTLNIIGHEEVGRELVQVAVSIRVVKIL